MTGMLVDIPAWLGVAVALLGVLGVGGAGWAVAKSKGYRFLGRQVVETPAGKKVQLRFAVR